MYNLHIWLSNMSITWEFETEDEATALMDNITNSTGTFCRLESKVDTTIICKDSIKFMQVKKAD